MGTSPFGSLTVAYQEWIRFGVDPVLPMHFWKLSKAEAKAFYTKVLSAIPERMRQLEALIHELRPQLHWKPDFTEAAFSVVVDVVADCVETRPRTRAEIEEHWRVQPEVFKTRGEGIRDWEGTDRAYSIAFDAGIYWALDLQRKEPRLKWAIGSGKTSYLRNQPILRSVVPGAPRRWSPLEVGPLDQFAVMVLQVVEKRHPVRRMDVYREWVRIISDYQREVPPSGV